MEFLNLVVIFATAYLVLRKPHKERLAFGLLVFSVLLMVFLFSVATRTGPPAGGELLMRRELLYSILALAVLLLSAVPVGVAVFVLGFVYGDSPCVMCWSSASGWRSWRWSACSSAGDGPKPKYVGLGVLIAVWGVFMGIRHTGMHAARDVGQGSAPRSSARTRTPGPSSSTG